MALTAKQERFVAEYICDLNGAAAYRRAGYKVASDKAAAANAARLIANDSIAAAIAGAQQARQQRTGLTQDLVVESLQGEAEYYGEGCSHSARVSAWKLLGQHLGMFVEKKEITGKGGGPVQIRIVEIIRPTPPTDLVPKHASGDVDTSR
ncbi:MAG TPA: terminase small subunit [Solirubrobacteraceae bacterium]